MILMVPSGVIKLLTNDKILLLNDPNTFDFGTLGGHGQGNAEAPKKSGAELYVDPNNDYRLGL